MANTTGFKARVEYEVTNGTQTTYMLPFSYIRKKFVMVSILHSDATETALEYGVDYTVNNLSVSLTTPAQVGEHIIIYRQTSTDKIVTWNDGSILLAQDMNTEDAQMLHLQEEQQDYIMANSISTKVTSDKEVLWDALNHRIINVSDPKDPQDAVTKKYMESVSDGFVAKNTTIQNDINSRQTDIIARQADVTTKQANVASMKTSVEEIQADVTTKQANVASMKTSVEEIKADVITRQTDVITKQADVTTKQANVASMKTSVEESKADVVTRQTDVTTKQADVTTRQTDVINRHTDVINRQTDVTNMQTNISALQAKFNVPTQIFPGTILPWGSTVIPYGYLLCDGSAVSRTTYSELFAQIGTTFGSGDGSTTFNLPDGQNRTMVGKGTLFASLGLNGGKKEHTLTEAELPVHNHPFAGTTSQDGNHTHTVSAYGGESGSAIPASSSSNTQVNTATTSSAGTHTHTFSGTTGTTGSGIAHNNMPPYLVVNWIIKYTSVGKSNADRLYRQDSTVYTQGDVLQGAQDLSKALYLVCTTGGTTDSAPPTWTAAGTMILDGTVEWEIRNKDEIVGTSPITVTETSGNKVVSHAVSGVTVGTYNGITVNALGHVTAFTQPTTLAGYEIADTYTKNEVNELLNGIGLTVVDGELNITYTE